MAARQQRPSGFQQQTDTASVASGARHVCRHWLGRVAIFCASLLLLLSGSLTQLAQPGSFLLSIATAHAAAGDPPDGKNTYQPVYDKGGTPIRPADQVDTATANTTPEVIKRNAGPLMPAFDVPLSLTDAATATSSDGQLEIAIPAKAVSPAFITKAGGALHLHVTQLQGPSGGSAGGHIIFGSFLITLVGPHGVVPGALAQQITATLHLPSGFRGAGSRTPTTPARRKRR